ncbi:MAG: DUF1015 domain-containing protein [Acidimicrobiia bacterium]|nr:DUF1015 domain-containing protein [Acidimicrobiia bacterium]
MKILPFRGYRYNPEIVRDLDDVISPPYDQFKEGLDDLLFARHPYNMAHLIVNKESPADTETDNRYTRSRELLQRWLAQRVFVQDPQPSLYPYFQTYETEGLQKTRKAFVALGEVSDYAEKVVLPHERTLSKPKQDRLKLLRSTLADTGLVFMLYSDPAGEIETLLNRVTGSPPDMRALDLNGEKNELWRVSDPAWTEQIARLMADRQLIIADGHHRYEVARAFGEDVVETRQVGWELCRYKLMSFVRMESEGITIFPIHRLLHSLQGFDPAALLRRMNEHFVVEEYPIAAADKFTTLDFLMQASKRQQRAGGNAFVFYFPHLQRFALIKLREGMADGIDWPADKGLAWRRLDVSVLHVGILERLLGIGEAQLAEQTHLEYVSHHGDAVRLADAKPCQCAVLMNATPIEQVKEVVEAGDVLPQKSTHFHPKMMEGLVFARHGAG